jgi:hypothetical protein
MVDVQLPMRSPGGVGGCGNRSVETGAASLYGHCRGLQCGGRLGQLELEAETERLAGQRADFGKIAKKLGCPQRHFEKIIRGKLRY